MNEVSLVVASLIDVAFGSRQLDPVLVGVIGVERGQRLARRNFCRLGDQVVENVVGEAVADGFVETRSIGVDVLDFSARNVVVGVVELGDLVAEWRLEVDPDDLVERIDFVDRVASASNIKSARSRTPFRSSRRGPAWSG